MLKYLFCSLFITIFLHCEIQKINARPVDVFDIINIEVSENVLAAENFYFAVDQVRE